LIFSYFQNYKRVIEVWFDDKYKEYFYTREPMARFLDHGDISKQLEIKERLKCKNFQWFMDTVAPDMLKKYPELPPNLFWGELKNKGSMSCLDTLGRPAPTKMGISGCHGFGNNQVLKYRKSQARFLECVLPIFFCFTSFVLVHQYLNNISVFIEMYGYGI